MADAKTLTDKLVEARIEAKQRKCNDMVNILYTSIKSDPFIKEVIIPTNSKEEAECYKLFLEKEGLTSKINSRFEISRKVTTTELTVTIPFTKEEVVLSKGNSKNE
tara:strand:+ start:94 stop:411 length:318 start_codon:yes stop_codon:yes gene_type:complete